jgi:hypothetical protein
MKTLADISMAGLRAELDAAIEAETVADYQDGLGNWRAARAAARARQDAVIAELALRRQRGTAT